MSAIGGPKGGFVSDTFALGENDVVYHNNYFSQVSVMEAISGWLPLGLGAGGGEDAMAAGRRPPPTGDAHAFGRAGGVRGADGDVRAAQEAAGCEPPTAAMAPAALEDRRGRDGATPEPRRSRSTSPQPRRSTPTSPPRCPDTWSRRPTSPSGSGSPATSIAPTEGSSHAEAEVQVDPNRPLSVQVVGKKNVTVTGTGADVFALPPGGGTSELAFTAQAVAPGDCVVTVVVSRAP